MVEVADAVAAGCNGEVVAENLFVGFDKFFLSVVQMKFYGAEFGKFLLETEVVEACDDVRVFVSVSLDVGVESVDCVQVRKPGCHIAAASVKGFAFAISDSERPEPRQV